MDYAECSKNSRNALSLFESKMSGGVTPEKYFVSCRRSIENLEKHIEELQSMESEERKALEDLSIFIYLLSLLYLRRDCFVSSVLIRMSKARLTSTHFRDGKSQNIILPDAAAGSRKLSLLEACQRWLRRVTRLRKADDVWFANDVELVESLNGLRLKLAKLAQICGEVFWAKAKDEGLDLTGYSLETMSTVSKKVAASPTVQLVSSYEEALAGRLNGVRERRDFLRVAIEEGVLLTKVSNDI